VPVGGQHVRVGSVMEGRAACRVFLDAGAALLTAGSFVKLDYIYYINATASNQRPQCVLTICVFFIVMAAAATMASSGQFCVPLHLSSPPSLSSSLLCKLAHRGTQTRTAALPSCNRLHLS